MADVSISLLMDIQKATKSVDSFVGKTEKALLGLAGAAAAVFTTGKLIDFLDKAIDAASESEDAFNKLSVAMKLSGDFSESAAENFKALADELQATTTFTDEAVLNNIAMAKSFNTTNEEAEKLIRAAADLSAITGRDLSDSTQLLGRSLDGTAGKLTEIIPEVRGLTKEQLAAGGAIDLVASKLNGAAAALGGTFSGQLIKTKNSFGEIVETLGGFITKNTFVIDLLKQAQIVFANLNKSLIENKTSLLELVKDGILVLIKSLEIAGDTIKTFDVGFTKIRQASKSVFGFLTQTQDRQAKENAEIEKGLSSRRALYDDLLKTITDLSSKVEKTDAKQIETSKKAADALKNQNDQARKLVVSLEDINNSLKKISDNPFTVLDPKNTTGLTQTDKTAGVATGALKAIAQGEKGAVQLVSQAATAFATAVLGPIGQFAGPIVEILAQGPEKVREFVEQFINALPGIVENIILAIPELITALAEKIPEVISAFIERIPEIIQALIAKLPDLIAALAGQMGYIATTLAIELIKQAPKIAIGFVDALVKEAPRFVTELIKSIGGNLGGAAKGVGSIFGGIGKGIGKVFGFAEGGIVPSGYPDDGFPARLTSGEFVADNELTQRLNSFLDRQTTPSQPGVGGAVTVVLQIGEAELAKVLLNLNQNGFRTS